MSTILIFINTWKEIFKISSPYLVKGFEIKIQQKRALHLYLVRNGISETGRGGWAKVIPTNVFILA